MSRRNRQKKGQPIHGWVAFDKPVGMGSTQAVSFIKRLYQAQKAGHAGTLDPLASGCLPIALGEATKTVPYVIESAKTYHFTVQWGAQTTTDDLEGDILHTSNQRPNRGDIEALMPHFTGLIEQVPPHFSAIKINGERAYDKAREGHDFELKKRNIEIYALKLLDHKADYSDFEIKCGKGTYIRSLARDMGQKLGCYGHISVLRRPQNSSFQPCDLVTKKHLEKCDQAHLHHSLLPLTHVLQEMISYALNEDEFDKIRHGMSIALSHAYDQDTELYVTYRDILQAIGFYQDGFFVPKRVFNL